jgi:hypothetical protein
MVPAVPTLSRIASGEMTRNCAPGVQSVDDNEFLESLVFVWAESRAVNLGLEGTHSREQSFRSAGLGRQRWKERLGISEGLDAVAVCVMADVGKGKTVEKNGESGEGN